MGLVCVKECWAVLGVLVGYIGSIMVVIHGRVRCMYDGVLQTLVEGIRLQGQICEVCYKI